MREKYRLSKFTQEQMDYNTMPSQQSVASMQRELKYLRQQVDFLKKITKLDNDKKPRA